MEELQKNDYLKLFELCLSEEHYFNEAHHKRAQFFSGFLSAIFLGTITGFFTAKNWYEYLFICVGPILAIIIAKISISATRRYYRRCLETIAYRAKIEYILGFYKPISSMVNNEKGKTQKWYESESLLHLRYEEDRDKARSSIDFTEKGIHSTYQKNTEMLFIAFIILNEILIFSALIMAIKSTTALNLFFPNIIFYDKSGVIISYDIRIAYSLWILLLISIIIFLVLWILTLVDYSRRKIRKEM